MKAWIRVLAGVMVTLVLVVCAGFFLPADYRAERSIHIAAPPDRVWALIEDPRQWSRWTAWNRRDPAMTMVYSGATAGVGAVWQWQSRSEGNGRMAFVGADAGRRLDYRLEFEGFDQPSFGSLALAPDGQGVKLTWSMHGTMDANPVDRWFGVLMDRMVGPDFEAGLNELKRLAESAR